MVVLADIRVDSLGRARWIVVVPGGDDKFRFPAFDQGRDRSRVRARLAVIADHRKNDGRWGRSNGRGGRLGCERSRRAPRSRCGWGMEGETVWEVRG